MSRNYEKPFLTVPQQRELLESRGLLVADPATLEHSLRTIGYYRLSAYTHTFRQHTMAQDDSDSLAIHDSLIEGTSAEHVLRLYEFDRRLKLLVLDAVERIEIAMRFSVAHTLGRRDPFGHLNPGSLDVRFTAPSGHDAGYAKWLEGYGDAQGRAKEAFVAHFETKYDGRLPIWVAVEIMHFGQLSVLYKGLKPADRHSICSAYGLPDPKVLSSWLHSMTYIRNVCAHHSRLWNRNLDVQPRLPAIGVAPPLDHLRGHLPNSVARVYGVLCVIRFLMRQIDLEGEWAAALHQHIENLPVGGPVGHQAMGFPSDWRSQPLWHGSAN